VRKLDNQDGGEILGNAKTMGTFYKKDDGVEYLAKDPIENLS